MPIPSSTALEYRAASNIDEAAGPFGTFRSLEGIIFGGKIVPLSRRKP